MASARLLTKLRHELVAVCRGQEDIAQHEVRLLRRTEAESLWPIGCREDVVTPLPQGMRDVPNESRLLSMARIRAAIPTIVPSRLRGPNASVVW